MSGKTCLTCIHWKNDQVNPQDFSRAGECWWGPPQIIPTQQGLMSTRVMTGGEFVCHKHEDRADVRDPLKEAIEIMPGRN